MKKLLTLIVLMNLLAPGTTNAGTNTEAPYFAGRNVYIRLVKQDDGWHFSDKLSLRPTKSDERGMDILLNDLSIPATNTHDFKVRLECIPIGHCAVNNSNYKNRKDALATMVMPWTGPFYRSELDVGSTLVSNTLGLVLTVGMVTGASETEYSFDHQAFTKALEEAVRADGMTDERRRQIIEGFDNARGHRAGLTTATLVGKLASAQ